MSDNKIIKWVDGRSMSSTEVRSLLQSTTSPIVFTNMTTGWPASKWSLDEFTKLFGHLVTTIKLYRRAKESPSKKPKYEAIGPSAPVVMETECSFVNASINEFQKWIKSSAHSEVPTQITLTEHNPHVSTISAENSRIEETAGNCSFNALQNYPYGEYWAYADYKYMAELFADCTPALDAVDWSVFGFPNRNGFESTLWLSSDGAFTPCHQDAYGTNLIAQLDGIKRWIVFPPDQTIHMQPTRVPYEESSIFSLADPKTNNATKLCVDLSPGMVLFLPKHWWHYVESLTPSISINTWLEHETDSVDRLKESLVNMLVYSFKSTEKEPMAKWLNPFQVLPTSFASCVDLVQKAAHENCNPGKTNDDSGTGNNGPETKIREIREKVDSNFVINCFTDADILEKVVSLMMSKIN